MLSKDHCRQSNTELDYLRKRHRQLLLEIGTLKKAHIEKSSTTTTVEKKSTQPSLLELIVDNSPAILFRRVASEDIYKRKTIYVSPNISRFGYQADDFMSGRMMCQDLIYPEDFNRTLCEIESFQERDLTSYSQTYRIVTRRGEVRWVEDRTSIIYDSQTGSRYYQGILIDIHQHKEAEIKLQKSEEKYRQIVETSSEGFLLMDKEFRIIDANQSYSKVSGYGLRDLIGRKFLVDGCESYSRFWASQGHNTENPAKFECCLTRGDGHQVPILIHPTVLYSDNGDVIGNMAFITDLTEQKKTLILAGEVQRCLLPPQSPTVTGLDIAGRNIQCDEVGGDYFDFLDNDPDGHFSVVVGDVSGHGVDSALLMASSRAFFRMHAAQQHSCAEIVTAMNRTITEDIYHTGRFLTLFCVNFHPQRKRIEWVRAGHDPALLYTPKSDTFEELKGEGIALGINADYIFQNCSKSDLQVGQILIIGTDGLWEGRNIQGEMFGKKRLKNIIATNSSKSSQNIVDAVLKDHALFSQGAIREDDLTLVIIKIGEEG